MIGMTVRKGATEGEKVKEGNGGRDREGGR